MSSHRAKVTWKKTTPDFTYEGYDRTHEITFEGGSKIKASSAKEFMGKAELVNPEESLAGALASCHMLTFLAVAAKSRLTVESYDDEAIATLDKGPKGKLCVTNITLQPKVRFSGEKPTPERFKELHEKSHANCFIANSLACTMTLEPQML